MTTIKVGSKDAEGFHPNGDIVDPDAIDQFIGTKYAQKPIAPSDLPSYLTQTALTATYASYINLAKNPDLITTGAVTLDTNNLVTSAAVVWPDGTPGALTITSRDANNAVLAYNITYGSPVTKTFTQPAITRNAAGAATNVPQIVVS